jgi:alpha-tubulin suppressor-like RCC1 family protein
LCWGNNNWGALGDGTTVDRMEPAPVIGVTDAVRVTGEGSFCALRSSGAVMCWGNNQYGQLGDGTREPRTIAVQVAGVVDATQVETGGDANCALRSSGAVMCWGSNASGQMGRGTVGGVQLVPMEVSGIADAVEIAVGSLHACARLRDGTVMCWGNDAVGQLGDDGEASPARAMPVRVAGLTGATGITATARNTCARKDTGELFCWGNNHDGQVGAGMIGEPSAYPLPTEVLGGP